MDYIYAIAFHVLPYSKSYSMFYCNELCIMHARHECEDVVAFKVWARPICIIFFSIWQDWAIYVGNMSDDEITGFVSQPPDTKKMSKVAWRFVISHEEFICL